MRIALIGPAYPDKGGGARHTTELAYRLAAAGHNVIIESWRAPDPVDAPDRDPYPRTHRRLAWYRPDTWIAACCRLRSADLVVFVLVSPAQVPSYLSVLTALALGPDRPRTAVICHTALPAAVRGEQGLTRTLLARADTVIVHSAAQAAQARALAPEVPIVIARMPPHLPAATPVPEDLLAERSVDRAPGHPKTRLLFFGVVRPDKGLDLLLQAVARTPEHVTLTVAGEFAAGLAQARELIAALGLGTRVALHPGYVPAAQVPALFAVADALVLPYREAAGSQNVLLAFSFGVPVVATTAGALAEAVRDGVDGLTCAPGDVEDLARALNEIAAPETARRLRAGVRAVDPAPYWGAYLRAVLARGSGRPRPPRRGQARPAGAAG